MNKKCPNCKITFFTEEDEAECIKKSVREFMVSRFQLCSKCSEKLHLTVYINGSYSIEERRDV